MDIESSFNKSRRLQEISKKLSKPLTSNDIINQVINGLETDNQSALNELVDLAESDDNIKTLMHIYNATRQDLVDMYDILVRVGAGQYANGHHVAASSLVFPQTLKFLFDHYTGKELHYKNLDHYSSSLYIANRLIEYFAKDETGEIV